MSRKWAELSLLFAVSALISFLISAAYAYETRRRLKWYVDGKVAAL